MDAPQQYSADVTSVTAARRMVAGRLAGLVDESLVETAALLTCELAQNAVRHAGSAFTVAVSARAGSVRIEVADAGPAFPRLDAGRARREGSGPGRRALDPLGGERGRRRQGRLVRARRGPARGLKEAQQGRAPPRARTGRRGRSPRTPCVPVRTASGW